MQHSSFTLKMATLKNTSDHKIIWWGSSVDGRPVQMQLVQFEEKGCSVLETCWASPFIAPLHPLPQDIVWLKTQAQQTD